MDSILKAKIPSTGQELPRVGLGTYKTFDVAANRGRYLELLPLMKAFKELKGSLVDSSPMYGSSEKITGDLSFDSKINSELFMATKVWISGKAEGIRQMKESFARLRRTKIELMQIHNLVDWKTHLKTLREWKEEGKIDYIGITHYTPSAFDEMEKILLSEKIDFIQIPYSIAETAGENGLIPLASELGVAVISNEPFAHGALFRKVRSKDIPEWVQELGITTWAQYFLKYILSSKDVQFVIPATSRLENLKDNMSASYGALPTLEQREKMRLDFTNL